MAYHRRKDFLVFGQPMIGQDEIDEWMDSVKKSWPGTGEKVTRFEQVFAAYKRSPFAAAVSSCSAALHLSCLALGIKPGDEVITSAMTFCATVNAIIHAGAVPVLADMDPLTQNIDPDDIERKITPKTKALIIVHFAGRPCDMKRILPLARSHGLLVIEDCAHAIETEYHGAPSGTMGDAGCFSFYATKNITTVEGGMLISANEEFLSTVRTLSMHGLSADAHSRSYDNDCLHYTVEAAGFKYNMTDLQAAFGIHQLKRIEEYLAKRKQIWDFYLEEFKELPVTLPFPDEAGTKNACHLFTLGIDPVTCGMDRDEFIHRMHRLNIGCGVHYQAIPSHAFYRKAFHFREEDFPHAVNRGKQTVSIPLSPKLTEQDVQDVTGAVKEALSR